MGQWSSLTWGACSFDCTPLFLVGLEVGCYIWRWVIRFGGGLLVGKVRGRGSLKCLRGYNRSMESG